MAFNLERFITEEQFIQCSPITADEFVRLSKDCDLRVDKPDLEMLERAGLFYPLFRVRYPKYIEKIHRRDKNHVEIPGPLEDKDIWDGDTREAYGHFWFSKNMTRDFYREGLLWRSQDRGFEPWKNFSDEHGRKAVESYYSPFQLYPLWTMWQTTTVPISLISWGALDKETLHCSASEWASVGKELTRVWADGESRFSQAADICIAIANRYFPKTQSDRRMLSTARPGHYHDWDWYEYGLRWDPKLELSKLGIEPKRLRDLQRGLAGETQHIDPLADWYSIVQFVALERKKRLKGKALLAQWFYAMEKMLRLFYEDLTDHKLPPPDDDYHRWKERYYGQGVPERELEFLEYLANEYHLNPRPRVILVVEGESEFDQIPRIADELLGYPLERVGIRLELLRGITEFTGGKADYKRGGRLARFIDYHHQLQTIVYVILDNEGKSQKVKERLIAARSKYPQSRRHITKEDYVFLWERNFEFDNFSDSEIASALSELAGRSGLISETEVHNNRENFGKPGFQLEKLFHAKTRRELRKRELAKLLVDRTIEMAQRDKDFVPPMVLTKLHQIIQLAVDNYQPTCRDTWMRNQASGFLAPTIS
ncbi:MAG: hypothetical protein HY695_26535 [Deltaproteobacteria bacterium]|nr:hypothetical protein [Deltaproteobacteria bacterium]